MKNGGRHVLAQGEPDRTELVSGEAQPAVLELKARRGPEYGANRVNLVLGEVRVGRDPVKEVAYPFVGLHVTVTDGLSEVAEATGLLEAKLRVGDVGGQIHGDAGGHRLAHLEGVPPVEVVTGKELGGGHEPARTEAVEGHLDVVPLPLGEPARAVQVHRRKHLKVSKLPVKGVIAVKRRELVLRKGGRVVLLKAVSPDDAHHVLQHLVGIGRRVVAVVEELDEGPLNVARGKTLGGGVFDKAVELSLAA